MHITRIEIENIPPLGQEVTFECDKRVNLFIGPNASGKTTVLRRMVDDVQYVNACYFYHKGVLIDDGDESAGVFVHVSDDWAQHGHEPDPDSLVDDIVPLLYIPATRVNLPVQSTLEDYGTDDSLQDLFDTDCGIFYGQNVKLATDWLRKRMDTNRTGQAQLRRVVEVVGYSCAKSICPEVIHDDTPHLFVEADVDIIQSNEYPFGLAAPVRTVHYAMGIGTNDQGWGEPLYAGVLSSGTQGTLLWIWALALKMAFHYEWGEGWENKPAILLIDEIENHLHPTWQRRVIPALLEHFPKLQIFATTHSPFVVAGLRAGQVHLLNRDENGVVTATTNEQDVIGWTADEILRTMMGVTYPTDDHTAKAAAELRELRNELPRADEQEEEERQQRIQELRQRVNRDLLAGGPMAAQRELFEQNLAEILEEHRRSQNLGQE